MSSTTKPRTLSLLAQSSLMFAAFAHLTMSDAFYSPYLLFAIASFAALIDNARASHTLTRRARVRATAAAILFSLMVSLANYALYSMGGWTRIERLVVLLTGTFFAFMNIFTWIGQNSETLSWHTDENAPAPRTVFAVTFVVAVAINLFVLLRCCYPGILTSDSTLQIRQLLTHRYSNHHPYWHTQTIKLFIDAGLMLFGNINAAVACYSCFSVLVMASAFALANATVREAGAPTAASLAIGAFYTLMPYHIMYSISMWKDVFFGASILLIGVFFFRISMHMSGGRINYLGLALASLATCLYRSNGLFVFLITLLFAIVLWRQRARNVLVLMSCAALCAILLKYPVLKAMNVNQTDTIESLSIPAQQIARDIIENDDFSQEHLDLLNQVIDVERVPQSYNPMVSDPIKNLVREKDNETLITGEGMAFVKLYATRLAMHPGSYIKAWVDQTKGYWNSGYDYWHWVTTVDENEHGIVTTVADERARGVLTRYLNWFETTPALQLFLSIGLFDWLALICCYISICRQDHVCLTMVVPVLATALSLLIATPVALEFRYDYAVFCALPFIIACVLRPNCTASAFDARS